MSWWNAKYTNNDGEYEITFASKEYEKTKAVEKVCCAVMDRAVKSPMDVEVVVRCRECKYWGDEDGKLQDSDGVLFARCKINNYLLDGRHTGWCPKENDFCSCGERKEGADNG